MSFEEEWAELKRRTAADQSARMQLAGLDGDGGGFKKVKWLKVTPSVLNTRAAKADEVRGNFRKADDAVMQATGEVKTGLTGFQSAGAFAILQARWKDQMTYLDQLLEHGVSGALRKAAAQLSNEEAAQTRKFKDGRRIVGRD